MLFLTEFINALGIEIDALKKGKGGSIVTVYNGEFLKKTLEYFIYQFSLENFLIVLDDTPANIELNGKEYDCDIISITGQQVQIAIKEKLSERIPIAKIKTNTWYLLERLKKRYEDNLNNTSKFDNSNKLFHDNNEKIDDGNSQISYSDNNQPPNPSQVRAIQSSINDFISIIWGPPGTGKTATIARAIESHINLGRKVLLLSHSNNAVDQALIQVAHQMKNTYYKECLLVRLGTPKIEMLEKIEICCPLVLIEKISEHKSKELMSELTQLKVELDKTERSKLPYKYAIILNDIIIESLTEIKIGNVEITKIELQINSTKDEIQKLNTQIRELTEKLTKAQNSGALKRFISGLDSKKIETSILIVNNNIVLKENHLKDLEAQNFRINQKLRPFIEQKEKAEQELSTHLSKLNKTLNEIKGLLASCDKRIKEIGEKIEEINKTLEEVKARIINDSKLIATTLTKSYLSKELENVSFDILIVDEVSMAPMPMLYWGASKATKGITIVGDFKQLPPICISDDELAKKWLGRSIFDELNISNISKAEKRVQLLNKQYRMHPHISGIVNKEIYDNRLEDDSSVIQHIRNDSISGKSTLCLVNTSPHNPWCSQFETGGRFNLISALISVSLAKQISTYYEVDESIGIITPYRNQARLISKIAEDIGLSKDKIRINTVHSFQGGEETVIIFDSVEGEGAKRWSMINENNNIESAKLLLNVALTRAKTKLYVIANCEYIKGYFEGNTFFMDIIRTIELKGKEVKSTDLISDLKDENFDYWISILNSLNSRPENIGVSYTEQDFWPAFHNDLAHAKEELIIFSPFLTAERMGKLHLLFTELIKKRIKIYVITLPPNEQPPIMIGSKDVLVKLGNMGVIVKFRHTMHEKIALIDREIKWIGSLNILSHNTKKEYMERISGETSGKELFEKFDLENLLINPNINGDLCPECLQKNKVNFIVPKYSRQNRQFFYGCSSYPDCLYTANTSSRTFGNSDKSQSKNKQQKEKKSAKTPPKNISSNDKNEKDLFDNNINGTQWETQLCYWSSVKLPAYRYSEKKKAWWKSKKN